MADEQGIEGSAPPTEEEMRAHLIDEVFNGDRARFHEFCRIIEDFIPPGTAAVLRGSAVTGERWKDGAPFDADGPGTSDLDLTLVGDTIMDHYKLDGFYVPGLHTKPMGEKHPDIAPGLVPLQEKLEARVNRPVNIQASRDIVMYIRGDLIGQPYLTLCEKKPES